MQATRPRLCGRNRRQRSALDRSHLQLNGVPVISSMALGFDGEYYNINADEMAAAAPLHATPTRSSFLPMCRVLRAQRGKYSDAVH